MPCEDPVLQRHATAANPCQLGLESRSHTTATKVYFERFSWIECYEGAQEEEAGQTKMYQTKLDKTEAKMDSSALSYHREHPVPEE